MAEMVSEGFEHVVIALHTAVAPPPVEWEKCMALARAIPRDQLAVLVVTDGGAPNSVQRAQWNQVQGTTPVPVAVISDLAAVRGVVRAMSWFNPAFKSFSPGDLQGAAKHVRLPDDKLPALRERVRKLVTQLSTKVVRAGAGI
jgi:hypothetical protein